MMNDKEHQAKMQQMKNMMEEMQGMMGGMMGMMDEMTGGENSNMNKMEMKKGHYKA